VRKDGIVGEARHASEPEPGLQLQLPSPSPTQTASAKIGQFNRSKIALYQLQSATRCQPLSLVKKCMLRVALCSKIGFPYPTLSGAFCRGSLRGVVFPKSTIAKGFFFLTRRCYALIYGRIEVSFASRVLSNGV